MLRLSAPILMAGTLPALYIMQRSLFIYNDSYFDNKSRKIRFLYLPGFDLLRAYFLLAGQGIPVGAQLLHVFIFIVIEYAVVELV